jgi:hypothetical protein
MKGNDMRCCGVEISGSELMLAIVYRDAGSYAYAPTNPRRIGLGDDEDQDVVRSFHDTVATFLRDNHVDLVAVKKRASKGKFAGGSVSFKIEALLQIMNNHKVKIYSASTVAAKNKSLKFHISKEVFGYQKAAYLTACCALASQDVLDKSLESVVTS